LRSYPFVKPPAPPGGFLLRRRMGGVIASRSASD